MENKSIKQMLLLLLLLPAMWLQAAVTVQGVVVDDQGEPIIGANVVIKGSTTGTITDFDGNWALEVPDMSAMLQFSYFNETTHRYEVESANVTLELAASSADIRQTAVITTAPGVAKDTYINQIATSIETVESKEQLLQTDHIYTVLGAYVGKADIFDTLPQGIYVLNGVKYFKK